MLVAIIGCGEVGRAYAAAASAAGSTVVLIDPRPAPAAVQLAADIGATLAPSIDAADFAAVDRVWICVSGDLVPEICLRLATAGLPEGALVVDLTTASAADKAHSFVQLAASGIAYVDVVIMGAVAVSGATTALLGAGPGVDVALEDFRQLGAPTSEIAGGAAGDAATLKLLRTILTKGLESLAVESLIAAEKAGLRSQLYDVLGDVDEMGFVEFLNMLVRTHVVHAERRLHEVRRAEQQLAQMGVPSLVLPGSEARFAATSSARLIDPPPSEAAVDVDEAVRWLAVSSRGCASAVDA